MGCNRRCGVDEEEDSVAVVKGKILRFDETRGYGFIAPDSGGEDVFLHANALTGEKHDYQSGVPVEFEVLESDRGLKAMAVRIVRDASAPAVANGSSANGSTAPAPGSASSGVATSVLTGSRPGPPEPMVPVARPGPLKPPVPHPSPGLSSGSLAVHASPGSATVKHDERLEDDGLCDVLSSAALRQELVELCLESVPSMTGEQIVQLRRAAVTLARRHGWIED
jgi:CspA family cold shock protein